MSFALPVCHSSFSLLYGTASPEALINAADQYGYDALMLADFNNLYGCYDFYFAARDYGLKPLIATELSTELGGLLLICENHEGFKNLCRLITHYQLKQEPSAEILDKYRQGLICLTDTEPSPEIIKDIYRDNAYIEIGYEQPYRAYRIARKNGIKPAACPRVSFLNPNDFSRHRLLRAIARGQLLANLPQTETANKEEYLKRPEWYNRYFSPFPGAIANSYRIIEKCNLIFPERKNILPTIEIDTDHFEKLRSDALSGLRQRVLKLTGNYLSRLEYELSVIRHTGFVDYFLVVGEIIDFCHRERIAAVGRGSASGSLVSYCLGITQVDPIKERLYFERFLNEARSDCPDIDLDIDWRRRDDVLAFVYNKYGNERVAMIASYIHFQPRLAIRETAKAMGVSPDKIDHLVKHISNHPLERNHFPSPSSIDPKLDQNHSKPVLHAAQSIHGLPRHLGIHPGGIVITPRPLTDYIPLERAAKGIVVTQCDMYQVEKIGLVKIDILGQRGLAVIADCRQAVREIKGNNFEVPQNDEKTYGTLREGKTIGVFQIESPGMRALLKDVKPKDLNDITLALALIRPGASDSGMKKVFLDRFHGKEKTVYPHKNLEQVLKETCGVFIYQEQVILAAQKIAGFNLPASDLLRRAITKKRKEKDRTELQKRFLEGAHKNGVDDAAARSIFSQLAQFASFGFCKAHAATYGQLAYQSAYFKTHYPEIFMTAVLQNGGGYYPSTVYVSEARRLGVTILPPDVNRSETIDSLQDKRIYLGIGRVRNITRGTLEQIEKHRPFDSLANFLSRVEVSEREMENLIKVGFFDSIETSRPKLLWQYRLWGRNNRDSKSDLFKGRITPPEMKSMPDLVPFGKFEIFQTEKDILELTASFHPLSMLETYQPSAIEKLSRQQDNSPVTISGWLADRKRIKTRNGKSMVFLTFESLEDTFEVVLFPDTYNRCKETIKRYRYLKVEGRLNIEDGNAAIIAHKVSPAPTGLKEAQYI